MEEVKGETTSPKKQGPAADGQSLPTPKTRKRLYTALSDKLGDNPVAKGEFDGKNRKGKQEWLLKFRLDPSMSWCEAYNETSVERKRAKAGFLIQLTASQLAGPNYLNDKEQPKNNKIIILMKRKSNTTT